jgi:Tfp pilus assembly protein PilN
MVPNLASRPFLNTRPVWIVSIIAGLVAVVMITVNIRLYLTSLHDNAAQSQRCEELDAAYQELEGKTRVHLDALDKVPWRDLEQRVTRFNVILREHSFSWLKLFSDIERVMPYKVRLILVQPKISKDEVTLTLEAVARDRDAMLEFLDNLIADPSFSKPIPRLERTPEDGSSIGYLFSLVVTYYPQPGAEQTGPAAEES